MTKPWVELLKLLTVLAGIGGSAFGSYKAAQHDAKASANVSYEIMKEAVENLKENQRTIWAIVTKTPIPISKSTDFDIPLSKSIDFDSDITVKRADTSQKSKPWAGFVITDQLPKTLDDAVAKKQRTTK